MAREVTHPRVPVEQLRWRIAPDTLPFETTDELEPLDRIVGQNRALEALRFGIGMRKKGIQYICDRPAPDRPLERRENPAQGTARTPGARLGSLLRLQF